MGISDDPLIKRLIDDSLRFVEFATKRLWNHLFSKEIFYEKEFVVSPEQPPKHLDSRRRVDFIIERFDGRDFVCQVMVELKKAKAGPQDVLNVEGQLFSACYEYYLENRSQKRMWACSIWGPNVRIWAFDAGQGFLTPACPAYGDMGDKSSYLDFRTSEAILMGYFEKIKRESQPLDDVFRSDDSMSDDVILEELDPASVKFAVAFEQRSQGPKIKTQDGVELNTDKTRWEPAQCMVEGMMAKGY
ncbi:hypothetical protein CSHISOI_10729, partial [Colletotrichum shisoi]